MAMFFVGKFYKSLQLRNFEHNEQDNSGHGPDSGYWVDSVRVV